jgi:hypothetical protein
MASNLAPDIENLCISFDKLADLTTKASVDQIETSNSTLYVCVLFLCLILMIHL